MLDAWSFNRPERKIERQKKKLAEKILVIVIRQRRKSINRIKILRFNLLFIQNRFSMESQFTTFSFCLLLQNKKNSDRASALLFHFRTGGNIIFRGGRGGGIPLATLRRNHFLRFLYLPTRFRFSRPLRKRLSPDSKVLSLQRENLVREIKNQDSFPDTLQRVKETSFGKLGKIPSPQNGIKK